MYRLTDYTLTELIEKGSKTYTGRPALATVGGATINYEELEPWSRRVATVLARLGVRPGDKVAILSENRPQWGLAYFGIVRAGAVAVPILTDFTGEQIANILAHSDSRAVFVSSKFLPKIKDETGRRAILSVEDFSLIGPVNGKTGTDDSTTFSPPPVDADDLASIVYTSGTTGLSKGVMLTHRNIVSNAFASRTIIRLHRTDRLLSILPLAHTYEFTVGFVTPLMQGSCVCYLDKPPSATALLPALKAVRPSIMLSVPLVIEKIYRNNVKPALEGMGAYKISWLRPLLQRLAGIKLKKTFGGRLRFFGVGGAPLAEDVEIFLKAAGFPYAIGYGLTETAPLLAGCSPQKTTLRSTGPALKGVELRIAEPRPDTGEGEIQARGPNIMRGYYKDSERTAEVFTKDGWFKTGDLGVFDAEGRLFVRGRLKTMILGASGENIYPEEIEAVLNGSPYVQESLVYGDENGLTALVQLKPEVLEEISARMKDGIEDAEQAAERLGQSALHAVSALGGAIGGRLENAEQAAARLLERVKKETNDRLAAFSRLGRIKLHSEPFEKTPTQKIKRFLYPQRGPNPPT